MKIFINILKSLLISIFLISCNSSKDGSKNEDTNLTLIKSEKKILQNKITLANKKIESLKKEVQDKNLEKEEYLRKKNKIITTLKKENQELQNQVSVINIQIEELKEKLPKEEAPQNYSGAKLEEVKKIEFKQVKKTRGYLDQFDLYFSRDVGYKMQIFNNKNIKIFEKEVSTEKAKSEHNLGLFDNSLNPILDFGNYSYKLNVTLKDNSYTKTYNENFSKQAKPIYEFNNKISDISLENNKLFVALQAKDYSSFPEIHYLNTLKLNESPIKLNLDEKIIPKTIYDMTIFKNELFISGQKSGWGDNDFILVKYNLNTKITTALSDKIPCFNENKCSSIFSLQVYNDELYLGTNKGLYKFDGINSQKITTHKTGIDSDIKKIYKDKKNKLWILTMNASNGISYLSNNIWTNLN